MQKKEWLMEVFAYQKGKSFVSKDGLGRGSVGQEDSICYAAVKDKW